MTSPDRDLAAEDGGISEALMNSTTTVPVTPSNDDEVAARLMSRLDAPGTNPSSRRTPGENGNDADDASGGKTDHAMDDQLQVLSKIRTLQDELVKAERSARLGQKFENIESTWDSEVERLGSDEEQRSWSMIQQMRAQSYVKDTTAFAVGRNWAHESEESFIWNMLEREEHDKRLTERRAQWEAKKGITQPKVDDSLKPAWMRPNPHTGIQRPSPFPTFLDPLSAESRFNTTVEAQGYDSQERQLRLRIHEIVRQKHHAFMRWESNPMPPPPPPNTNQIDAWPRPVASYVHWKLFKYCSPLLAFLNGETSDLFAIDVLDGEPDLSVSRQSYDLLLRTLQNDGSRMPAGIPKMAHGLVPERIRLNGPQFVQTFSALGCDYYSSGRTQLVLLQPYRLLVYYDEEIRKRYAELKEKFEVSSDQKDRSHAGSPREPGHHGTTQGDVEREHHESTDAGAQSSWRIETGVESDNQSRDTTQNDRVEVLQRQPGDKANDESEESRDSGDSEGSESSESSEESNDSEKTRNPLAETKVAMDYLGCLIDFMDTTVSIRRNYIQGAECRKVHFRDLWYLFNPGDEVVRHDEKQVYRVIEVTNPKHRASSKNILFNIDDEDHSKNFQVSCVFVDFDGKKIGPVTTTFVIKAFAGERSVESLEVYPLRLHRFTANHERKGQSTASGPQTLRQQLIKRGRKFFQAARMKLENTFYNGPTADGEEVESQVVIDFETALSSKFRVPEVESLLSEADDASSIIISDFGGAVGGRVECVASCCESEYVCNDSFVDERRKAEYVDSLIPKNTYAKLPSVAIYPRTLDDTTGDNALTDDEFLLMSSRVFAFVLRTRKWGELDSFALLLPRTFFPHDQAVVSNLRPV